MSSAGVPMAARLPIGAGRLSASAYAKMGDTFADLCTRADEANPHMSPASVQAAMTLVAPEDIVVVAAHDAHRMLAGVWVFRRYRGIDTAGIRVLRTPLVPLYEVLSTPVLERGCAVEAMSAILDFIAADSSLPATVSARSLPLDGLHHDALQSWLGRNGGSLSPVNTWLRGVTLPRPGERPEAAITRMLGPSRKKRMTQRRGLERLGVLGFTQAKGQSAIPAFEAFLTLEARGWKGRQGTALLHRPQDLAWMRAAVAGMATDNGATVAALALDGRPIAMGLVFSQGGTSVFMKTTYDEVFQKHSPGLHLEIEVTRAALGDPGLVRFDCGGDEHVDPQAHIWAERRPTGNAIIALDAGPLSRLPVVAARARGAAQRLHRRLRG